MDEIKYCSICGTLLGVVYSEIICYNKETGRPERNVLRYCPVREALPLVERLNHYDSSGVAYLIEMEGE